MRFFITHIYYIQIFRMQLQTRTTEVVNEKMEKEPSYCFLEMEK